MNEDLEEWETTSQMPVMPVMRIVSKSTSVVCPSLKGARNLSAVDVQEAKEAEETESALPMIITRSLCQTR